MSQTPDQQSYPDDEIDLRELFTILWRGKWLILASCIIFGAAGIFYALQKPNVYQASALLAPSQNEGGSRLGGQLSGLASLAGVNLGGGDTNNTTIAKEVLQSRVFLSDFIHRYQLAAPLIAAESWSQRAQEWIYDPEVFNSETGEWLADEEGKSQKPTDWDLVKTFREQLSVSENKDNGLITVGIKSLSPPAAKDWVSWLVSDINEHMREQDVEEAEASVAYLDEKLRETNIAGMQQVFYQLIEQETRTIMLANAQREYVFKTVDPAVIPQEKSEPKRAVISLLSVMLGFTLGAFVVLFQAFIKGNSIPD